jgi:hypothetical protein
MTRYVATQPEQMFRIAQAESKAGVLSDGRGLPLAQTSERRKELVTSTTVIRRPLIE